MSRPRRGALALLTSAVLVAAACGRDRTDGGLESIGQGLHAPPGTTASVYATGLVNAAAFALDDQGRLWVAAAQQVDDGTDHLYVVRAKGATPVAVRADLHTPLGLLWYEGSLYVASAGGVDVLSGFDGIAFASTRRIVSFPAGTGEVNGLALLPDGRIALGISAPCDHCTPTLPDSASVVTFLPDGSDRRVEASGIRAPVGLTVRPGTGELLVTMNQRDDLGDATPGDWLAAVQPGQDWGFPDCYGQTEGGCADSPRPVAVLDPHAAVSGVAVVGDVALVAEWATAKVVAVDLARGTVAPFLDGVQRPEALLTTPTGTVLVGDWLTGTVYEVALPPAG